jgi:hypothetical protein
MFVPLHAVGGLSGTFGFEQRPVVELHVPARWQPSLGGHATEGTPVQVPFWQLYVSHKFDPVQDGPVSGVGAVHVPVPD